VGDPRRSQPEQGWTPVWAPSVPKHIERPPLLGDSARKTPVNCPASQGPDTFTPTPFLRTTNLSRPDPMGNPLGLLPLALAAGGGSVDGIPASQLVAAGLTLLQRSAPLIRALYGKRAGILLPTSPQFLTALAASEGRAAVLINPLAAPAEVAYQIADAEVGAVLTVAALAGKVPAEVPLVLLDEAPRSAVVRIGDRDTAVDLGSHVGLTLEGETDVVGSDEDAVIVYTSAMAGMALGARLTHRNLLANARGTVEASALTSADHVLAVLPYSHLFGLTVTLTGPLLAGARVTTMARFNPLKALDIIESDVTFFNGVPAVYKALLLAMQRRERAVQAPSLRVSICGGAALEVWVQEQWHAATGCDLRQGYGLTEASPVTLFNRLAVPNRLGTLGVSYPQCENSIRDLETGDERPRGVSGEICVRGESVGPGYVRGDADGLLRRDGWLYTGDRGRMDADGYVTFEGLIKPMFTRNGFNVYPAELERVIGALPGVTRVVVEAVPDVAKENDIRVTVYGAVSSDDVKRWCEALLSAYKQPSEIVVVH
jgi:long-chain acyl-CoA synthetase